MAPRDDPAGPARDDAGGASAYPPPPLRGPGDAAGDASGRDPDDAAGDPVAVDDTSGSGSSAADRAAGDPLAVDGAADGWTTDVPGDRPIAVDDVLRGTTPEAAGPVDAPAAAMGDGEADRGPAERAAPAQAVDPAAVPAPAAGEEDVLGSAEAESLRNRWRDVQAGFVDDPRQALRSAGELIEELVGSLTRTLDEQRRSLEATGDSATEQLRQALRRHRNLFDRLLGR